MSLYPSYGGHRQPHPPQPAMGMAPMHHAPRQSHQQHGQQQMQLQHDHNAFRHFYATQLATLTFNSRPIIQNLSMIAQQYVHWSGIVVQCLEAHIHRVPPGMKLPAFYLLDSICKNVYQEYAHRFAPMVTNMFLDAYRSVDHATQAKMEEMLVTWRNGAPGGRELFGVTPQIDIERIVFSGHGAGPSRPQFHAPPPISKKQVLAELEVALANKERLLQSNPYDQLTVQQVDTLQQLRNMVQYTDIAPQDLAAIQAQLASLATPPPQPAAPHVPPVPNAFHGHDAYAQLVPSNIPPTLAAPPSVAAVPVPGLALPAAFAALALPTSSSDPSILKIYDALLKAGIVNQDSGIVSKDPTPPPARDAALETELAYEALVMSMDAATTATDITRKRPPIASLLYQRLSAQCKQCSLRFADDDAGKRALQDHLDSHFRQNRRAQQNLGRGHSRSWFVGYDDWTTEKSANGKGKKRAAAAEASAEREAKLRASFVVVPAGEEASQVPCPVCKEVLKSEFQEDEEEWIWRNAVRVGDKVYHATCHADAFVQNPLVARLKVDAASRSRSQTPDVQPARSLSTRNSLSPSSESRGVKRKAENDDVVVKQEDGTPPLKRIALASVA